MKKHLSPPYKSANVKHRRSGRGERHSCPLENVSPLAISSATNTQTCLRCRTWFARVAESADGLIRSVLPPDLQAAAVELAPYLVDSIGNSTRIDYGTGHETTFCALLCCLAKLGVLTKPDLQVALRHLLQYDFSLVFTGTSYTL